jgi:hypothetical protein
MNSTRLKQALLEVAKECNDQGPGFAQETVVLRQAVEQLQIQNDLKQQQHLLTAWHDLFREGTLSWGYDVDNPASPFFHFAERERRPPFKPSLEPTPRTELLMADSFHLDVGQSIQSESGTWYRNMQILGTGGNAVTFLAVATFAPRPQAPAWERTPLEAPLRSALKSSPLNGSCPASHTLPSRAWR